MTHGPGYLDDVGGAASRPALPATLSAPGDLSRPRAALPQSCKLPPDGLLEACALANFEAEVAKVVIAEEPESIEVNVLAHEAVKLVHQAVALKEGAEGVVTARSTRPCEQDGLRRGEGGRGREAEERRQREARRRRQRLFAPHGLELALQIGGLGG